MPKIELQPWDLEIQMIKTGEYSGTRKAQIKWPLATDQSFLQELEMLGVKEYVPKEKDSE